VLGEVTKPPKAGSKAGPKATAKKIGKRFVKGASGNPAGMKRGTKHRRTILLAEMSTDDRATVTEKIIKQAKRGCKVSQRMIQDRLEPIRKAVGKFKLPETISTLEDVDAALSSVINAQAAGKLLPDEVAAALATIEAKRVLIMSRTIDPQLREIERMLSDLKGRP
jgi:hypothetical protein